MKEHFDIEDTQEIRLNDTRPFVNSYPYETVLLNPKYFFNGIKGQGKAMNIAFNTTNDPLLEVHEEYVWQFYDEENIVRVIDKTELFVKGLHVVLYVVQLQE